ncbi:uncharacterized protein LOC122539037 [Frieseomelitta varia]|uniref:uncharacterized protein LOC122539037 n=1 Tax=Frieseomelitta varia TaxID=561572 RepID=UPI001CB69725|nr:uncharacterized protein LOC122539037 [Frieseomelitta varia]
MDVAYLMRSDYAFNKKLLALLGLWPTTRSKFRVVLFYLYYVSYLLLQITWFFTLECDFTCVMNVLPTVLTTASVLLKYVFHHKYMTTVHALYMMLDLDWNSFKNDKQSIEILRRYATMAHVLSVAAMSLLCLIVIVVMTLSFSMLSILHMPKENCSRFWQRPFALKQLEKTTSVYNPSFILCLVTQCTSSMIWVAIDLTNFAFLEHVCALFKIVSCHLKRTTNEYVMKLPQYDETNIYTKIIFAVCVHTRATEFLQIMWDSFEMHYFWTVFCGTAAMSMAFVNLYTSLQAKEDGRAIILIFYNIMSFSCYTVLVTFFGQRLIDHSSDVFYETYNSYWYRIPLKAQKMYLMILLRSIKSCSFSMGHVFVSSLKGLCTVTRLRFLNMSKRTSEQSAH